MMNNNDSTVRGYDKTALVLDPLDNVAVALVPLQKGDRCVIRFPDRLDELTAEEAIEFGHKIALKDFEANEPVMKYGEEIGKMCTAIHKGCWIHNHNMYCERGLK
ncbi:MULTISPECIES: UxaA family hydrolase [unclassified Paenibacillus]|uniref:UxaA family hydrolase n=1 Tax=unclassified Paenibacillus TaxID=185978 RepID=UPI00363F3640